MRAESEDVLGKKKVPVREPRPSPRSRRKLPPSPAASPAMGRKLPPSPAVGRKLPQPSSNAVAPPTGTNTEDRAAGVAPGKDLSAAHLASSVAMLQRIQTESKAMRDELQRMQSAAKTARLVVQNSGSGSARASPETEREDGVAPETPTASQPNEQQQQRSADGVGEQASPKGSSRQQHRQPTAADTAIMNELKRSSGDFTDVLNSMDGVNIPEAILPEAIAPEAIATDQITGGAWFNARLGSGGSAAQQEIREAGEPEVVPATVVAAAPAEVLASVAAPSLATPGAAPPKELNMGAIHIGTAAGDGGGGSNSPSTPKRKNSISQKLKFWKRGSSSKKSKKKAAANRKSMLISGPVGVNGDLSGLTPEMAAAAKMMWEADEQLRAIRAGEKPKPYPGVAAESCGGGAAAAAAAELTPAERQLAMAKQLMQEKEEKQKLKQRDQTQEQELVQQQHNLADQLVREKHQRAEQVNAQQQADAETDLQKRLQRERDNREKMAVAAAASKAQREAREAAASLRDLEWQREQARLKEEADLEVQQQQNNPEFSQAQAMRDAEERFRQHEEWQQMKEAARTKIFAEGDTNGDGMLDLAEAKAQGMTESTFREIDADNSGTLTQAEFAAWHLRMGGDATGRDAGSPPPPPPPSSAPPPLDENDAGGLGDGLFDGDDSPAMTDLDASLPGMSGDSSAASSARSSPGGSGSDGDIRGTWLDTVADVHPYDQQFTIGEADEEQEQHVQNAGKGAEEEDWI